MMKRWPQQARAHGLGTVLSRLRRIGYRDVPLARDIVGVSAYANREDVTTATSAFREYRCRSVTYVFDLRTGERQSFEVMT